MGVQDSPSATDKGNEAQGDLLEEMKVAVRKALDPKTLFTRAILMLCPAAVLCVVGLACACESSHCGGVGIRPRVLSSLLLGVPFAPVVHTTNAALGVDLLGWVVLSFGLSSSGPRFFVFGVLFLAAMSGCATWLVGSSSVVHAGTAGVLFGIFGFHLCVLPFQRPLLWTDIASFCVFDIFFGGVWWGFHYNSPGYSHCLANTGLLSGVLLGWLYFRVLAGSLEVRDAVLSERMPLLHSGIDAMERAAESAVHAGSDSATAGLGHAVSAADKALAQTSPSLHRGIQATGEKAQRAATSAAGSGLALLQGAGLTPGAARDGPAAAAAAAEGDRSAAAAAAICGPPVFSGAASGPGP